ncbi:sulfurtransferase [Endozoicomonas montiporae]|uniref:Sulfurtransferase n=2 Tax=Endozoicomonas montiporae TaxID=1027273 RepID=A0A142B9B8_9GAMM|nr:sulfurtransferase [Endozoicomonas montiporae]AMO55344.1 thiosulfate sulfurtransferase [Endozoicomonas montiporae CL-33]
MGTLISAAELNQWLQSDQDVLVLDVRKSLFYFLGHIPGARNIWRPDYEADASEYPYKGMRASQQKMASLLGKLGATSSSKIVLYDDSNGLDAARVWWILKLYGHDQVYLLNGGLRAWKQARFSTSIKPAFMPSKAQFEFKGTRHPEYLAELKQIRQLPQQNTVLLDVRSADEFNGITRLQGAFGKGRIPDSVWLEYSNSINASGFVAVNELQQLFSDHGITPEKEIIVYCQSGVRSAHTHFVLTELLKYPNVKNYDGSWVEWSWYRQLAVETGLKTPGEGS